ncbi:Abnormal spindle-like microcephaly-assoc'd, ASPM-SPD-2-Hydin [Granulicella rosea]|uniref:Abnormal spindle-like microcephaly-assoc'd, ASPM-SPD-2-Hydin n=1 Tax=Granulicella rosea TaxID=474952 RepID=A0A239MHJ3_9BACT|nr:choice-of-anchor D domain-containing protein [Granulicella rosea]SNT41418.1 Abnormal spindle-like microcephaly-assoc'd, ASPM-SPD-2-Hydin [Granulicella rosea]
MAKRVCVFSFVLLALLGCGGGSTTTGGTVSPPLTPSVSLSASSLAFTQAVGATSAAQVVTVTNTGTAPLVVSGVTLSGANASSFAETNTCSNVAAGSTCTVSVTFSPASAGALAATLSLADNAANSPQSVALTGTGAAPAVSLSPASLAFTQAAGGTSAAQTVTLTNTGTAPLTVSGVTLSGANASSFAQTNTCSNVAAGATCAVSVTFKPAGAGSYTAALSFADNAANTPQTVALTGTGTAPQLTLSTTSLNFTQAAESVSAAQTVTLTNTGNAVLNLGAATITGANAWNFNQTTTCGTTLAAGANCAISVTFNPSLAAPFSASLGIASNVATQTVALNGTGTGTLTINTSVATDWKISSGAINLDFNPTTGRIFSVHLVGYSDELVDTTTTNGGQPEGLYSGNVGGGAGPVTSGYTQNGNMYIDFWSSTASSSTNAFTETQHYIITANDTGFHGYYVVSHSPTDIAGSLGQQQYIFRVNLSQFTNMYLVDSGLNNLGPVAVPLPAASVTGNTDPGRQVQNAVVDLNGLSLPTGWTRQFATKYDFSSYEYLHKAHGLYGSKYGSWAVFPRQENMIGGPSKQDLIFTENIVIVESLSSHYVLNIGWTPTQGVASSKLFGPAYFHFNAVSSTLSTPAAMYAEAQTYTPVFDYLYDNDPTLIANGHVASNARGTVAPTIAGGGSATTNAAWTVLGDNATNYQQTTYGRQYWVNNNASGTAPLTGVVPGTYRLSHYVLGQWGELRLDNVNVTANQTTSLPSLNFVPENFGTYTPIWTIGTPDRSAHEFLHGHDSAGNDLRNYYGAYNFWSDFAANKGAQIYYATAVGSTPATNDLSQLNYVQWGAFNPGLYAGVYNAADDTTDGYTYIVPSYVGNPATTNTPGTTIHFTTTAGQQAQGQYVVLSVGIASAEASLIATLNGHQLIWHYTNASDAMVRSGLAGFYQWTALQWDTANLNAPGADNVLTLSVSQADGVMLDALRMEITPTSADPAVTGWHDYTWAYGSKSTVANDAVPSN